MHIKSYSLLPIFNSDAASKICVPCCLSTLSPKWSLPSSFELYIKSMQAWSIAKGSKLAFWHHLYKDLPQHYNNHSLLINLPSSPECNLIENFPYSIIPNLSSNLMNLSGLIFFVKYTIDLNKDVYHIL